VYVVADGVEGLGRGVYYYAPLDGELVALEGEGAGVDAVAEALETPHRAAKAACAVLLTNVFDRYRFRYANRGYRYALIDSGHIGENLRLAAGSAGLGEWGPLRFHDDRLNRLIGVDGIEEAVCAVHLLGALGEPAAAERGAARRLVERHHTARPPPERADDAPERYHVATRLVFPDAPEPAADGAVARAGSPDGGPTAASGDPGDAPEAPVGGSATKLPERPAPGERVEVLIARRRSARRLEPVPIARADLGFVVEAAAGHPALRRASGVELRVFVHRVEGLAAGLYRAHPAERVLVLLRPGDRSEALAGVCLGQEKARQAAAAFVMVAGLEPGAAGAGQRAWRDRCLEAGSIGQRIYLAAEAVGLAARNLAAFLDDRLDELVGVDGRRRASLHLTVVGRGD
jgi:SagB-type dehydrogenase family enzyme